MQRVVLEIAGIAILFEFPSLTFQKVLFPFLSRRAPQLRVRFSFTDPPCFKKKTFLYQKDGTYRFYRVQDGRVIAIHSTGLRKELKTIRQTLSATLPKAILMKASLKEATFFLGSKRGTESFHVVWPYVYLLLSHLLFIRREGIFVHAAGVRDGGGRGFLFVGSSGAGKSTLARLLRQERTFSVLGDDVMALCRREKPTLFGTPLHSPLPNFLLTEGVPLEAIFFLRHGRKNQLTPLSYRESLTRLLPEIPFIPWAPEGHPFSSEFSLELCTSFPTYELSFVPDARVVSFLKRALRERLGQGTGRRKKGA